MKLELELNQARFNTLEEKTIVNILFTAYRVNDLTSSVLSPYDLSIQQFNILRILRGRHPECATVNLLRQRMMDKNSGVSRLVEKLRKKNLITRNINEQDRRQVDIRITEKGLDLLAVLDDKMKPVFNYARTLNPAQLSQLNDLLDNLRDQP
jgi:MarR family multiple gene transcriptional regulator MgrA